MKINKLFKALSIIFKKPYLLNLIINNDERYKELFIKQNPRLLYGFPVIDIAEFLIQPISIKPYSFMNGGSLITDIGLLQSLVKSKKEVTYFEIGTWRGESIANIASFTKECFTLNLSNEELKKMGYQDEYVKQQGLYSKTQKKIHHLKGNSTQFDFSPYKGKCDVVFIDGDHSYKGVLNDTKIAFELLRNNDSVILWHDYYRNPGEIRWDVLKAIYDGTPNDNKNQLFCVTNTLCAIYTSQSYPTQQQHPLTPNKTFEANLSFKKF